MTVSKKRIKEVLENALELTHNEQVEILVEVLQYRRDRETQKYFCHSCNRVFPQGETQNCPFCGRINWTYIDKNNPEDEE